QRTPAPTTATTRPGCPCAGADTAKWRRRGGSCVHTSRVWQARTKALVDAQNQASALFDSIEERGLIRAGVTESELSREIRALAAAEFGVKRHWHKRVVRSGPNTLQPYSKRTPDRIIGAD